MAGPGRNPSRRPLPRSARSSDGRRDGPRPDLPQGTAPETEARLDRLLEAMLGHQHLPMAVGSRRELWDKHIADSLSGLEAQELAGAGLIADLGAGAGLPGLVVAAALPEARVELIEGSSRKCRVAIELASAAGIENAGAIDQRSEEWAAGAGRERYGAVVARAVGSLAELCELASPLLATGGVLVAWKGGRDQAEEQSARAGAELTAMEPDRVVPVKPYAASKQRHLHVYRKSGPTPAELPRRPGQAHKRPLGT